MIKEITTEEADALLEIGATVCYGVEEWDRLDADDGLDLAWCGCYTCPSPQRINREGREFLRLRMDSECRRPDLHGVAVKKFSRGYIIDDEKEDN